MKCSTCNKVKDLTEFYEKRNENRSSSMCKKCFNAYCTNRWIQRKLDAVKYLGSKCSSCKKKYHYSVFEFHHKDPKQKDVSWTKLRLRSDEKIKLELDKCDLLCANCHRMKHYALVPELVSTQ
jgi:hypothetical protein